jgi:L-lactate dehydrogenase complex protein LldF
MKLKVLHNESATEFLSDPPYAKWHDQALWFVREKRDRQARSLPEWEALRDRAAEIKQHTVSQLAHYLETFEKNAIANGIQVHWAKDAKEHNQIIYKLLSDRKVTKVVKSKSMLTEECHLNSFLSEKGIEVCDTDLGEWIVQLRDEPPSHIVLPAIHIKKEQISKLFNEKIGTEAGNNDPKYLTDASRYELRKKFLVAEAGITGVNFAVAESGAFVVCTNEGNADIGTTLPPLHIASCGIEKLIPAQEDLGVFIRLLARSATGQPITTYTTHYTKPRAGGETHIILVDNGRTQLLTEEKFRRSLGCIRCGACLNTCPVYRRSGGYSYSYEIPGPIGSVLGPSRSEGDHKTLPFASTLCGSCTDVCPVKINLHEQLLYWRERVYNKGHRSSIKAFILWASSYILTSPTLYELGGKVSRIGLRLIPKWMLKNRLNIWSNSRELPEAPKQSFREIFAKRNEL